MRCTVAEGGYTDGSCKGYSDRSGSHRKRCAVLLQSGKEAGLSGALAGNSESYMSKSKNGGMDKMLAKATKWIALAWILLTLILSLV